LTIASRTFSQQGGEKNKFAQNEHPSSATIAKRVTTPNARELTGEEMGWESLRVKVVRLSLI